MSENMDEPPSRPSEEGTTKAPKDKSCPYCHQAFTSSSLGRHLDLYIRERNPKAPDGIHDVEAIRKTRQNITRRQPKGALGRRATSASAASVSRRSPASADAESSAARSPLSQRDNSQAGAGPGAGTGTPNNYPFHKVRWEDTGVIRNLAVPEAGSDADADGASRRGSRSGPSQRSASRQTLKQQLDARQQVQDAEDRARASELALWELLASFRAAKFVSLFPVEPRTSSSSLLTRLDRQEIEMNSMPFDFDPFSLDFPALTLKCLDPPPTLFASTQHPTSSSWSILPPGHAQLESLRAYFKEEFRHWKNACATATTAVAEELTYPPSSHIGRTDTKAEVLAAEKAAEKMEKHVSDHLAATYSIWNGLPQEQREQLWRLELARGVGRKQKEVDKLKEGQHLLRQENANLKTQVKQLTRLQQPREFKIAPPSTVYMDEKLVKRLLENGLTKKQDCVGFDLGDRHVEIGVIVSSVIDRWKKVIVSTRTANRGPQSQLPPDTGTAEEREPSPGGSAGETSLARQQEETQRPRQPAQARQPQSAAGTSRLPSAASTAASLTPRVPTTSAVNSAAPSVSAHADLEEDQDVSMSDADAESDADPDPDGDADGDTDADADADMDDDDDHGGYTNGHLRAAQPQQPQQQQQMLHPAVSMPPRQTGRLEVSRTRQEMWCRQGE